jgi:DeoR family transcriptional regulator, glycerol-3-phosphate regulon repressor
MVKTGKSKPKGGRHAAILAELRASPALRIVELAQTHNVSTETIRRDLDELSAAGLIARTYGGATGARTAGEPLLDERYRTRQDERQAVAWAVTPLIRDGDTLMIDAGATTIHVARRLAAEFSDLNVVTTSFGVASALAANPTFRIRVCPGDYDPSDGGVIGPDAVAYLMQFKVAHALIGASCLDADGPSDFNSGSVAIKRAMMRQSAQTILVLDHTKLGQAVFERVCPLGDLAHLATDAAPQGALAAALAKADVAVHLPG